MIRRLLPIALLAVTAVAVADDKPEQEGMKDEKQSVASPRVKLVTTLGDIVIELNAERTPITVQNFVQYVDDDFYNGTIFHRVMSNFMIQGGGFTVDVEKKPGLRDPIKNEWREGPPNKRGTIAMARLGRQPDSATAQFFINVTDNPALDKPNDGAGYCVFGKVVEGMDVVDKIRSTKVIMHEKSPPHDGPVMPDPPIIIEDAVVLGDVDRAALARAAEQKKEEIKAAERRAAKERLEQREAALALIEEDTGKKLQTTDSGLLYIVLKEGDGPSPSKTDTVRVHIQGALLDGKVFMDSTQHGKPQTFALGAGRIRGLTEGVAMMKVGGKWKLICPPDLAFGERGAPPRIPPDSMIVLDVELLEIVE
jgi:peptidyl-prolyl cis-trans isomerase A (cyclophilin A)